MINLTINLGSWGWPQWTYVAFTAFSLAVTVCKHGEPKIIKNHSVGESMFNSLIALSLLSFGGFFA